MDDSPHRADEEQEAVDGISEGEELDDGYGLHLLLHLHIGSCDCEESTPFSCLNFGPAPSSTLCALRMWCGLLISSTPHASWITPFTTVAVAAALQVGSGNYS